MSWYDTWLTLVRPQNSENLCFGGAVNPAVCGRNSNNHNAQFLSAGEKENGVNLKVLTQRVALGGRKDIGYIPIGR